MGSVRNIQKAITPIVEIDPNAKAQRQRRGKVVLEVSDPDAAANAGEQLSLADVVSPSEPSSTRTNSGKSSKSTPKSTLSKARQKSTLEASLKVPVEMPLEHPKSNSSHPADDNTGNHSADPQVLAQLQQLGDAIEQLQSRIDRLNQVQPELDSPSSVPAASPSPKAGSKTGSKLHLPDWHEPEIRPHYTIAEARQAYEALEQSTQKRILQTVAPTELQNAQQVAQRLRGTGLAASSQQRPPLTTRPERLAQTAVSRRRSPSHSGSSQQRRSTRRYQWDVQQLLKNLRALIIRLTPIPRDPGTKIVDAGAWILAAIGIRLVCSWLVRFLPLFGWPVNLLLLAPAFVAAYLAFCVEDSRSDVIYRLLLMTVGLFLGSRL